MQQMVEYCSVFCNLQSPKWLSTCLLQETAFPPLSQYQFGSVGPLACCERKKVQMTK